MSWGKYSPIYCTIETEGRKTNPSFGSDGFEMTIKVGTSLRRSRVLATIRVTPDTIDGFENISAKLFINEKEINL